MFAHAFGGAEEEPAVRLQREVKKREEVLLQLRAEVDQQIAATDQIELEKGRILDDVLLGEDQQVADAFVDAIAAAIGGEEARQAFGRKIGGDAGRIAAGAGGRDGLAVDVRGEELHGEAGLDRLHALDQQDGERVGLLARGTARGPDADHRTGRFTGKERGDDLFLQHLEHLRIAEEMGDADEHVTKQRLHLGGSLLEIFDVAVDPLDLVHGHAALDPAVDGARFVLGKVVAGLGAQQDEDLLQRVLDLGGRDSAVLRVPAKGVRGVADELRGHLGRQQFVVHQAGADGAARHAVELGRGRVLRHDHAALTLDRAHPLGAVAAGAREDDADGPLALLLGERAEEKIDGQTQAARLGGLEQLQRAVEERQVMPRRNDVDAVGPHDHAILDFEDRQARVAANEVGEDALVIRVEVLHEHEGHAGIGGVGQAGEERLERRQSARGRANADHRKPLRRLVLRQRGRFSSDPHHRRRRAGRRRCNRALLRRFLRVCFLFAHGVARRMNSRISPKGQNRKTVPASLPRAPPNESTRR